MSLQARLWPLQQHVAATHSIEGSLGAEFSAQEWVGSVEAHRFQNEHGIDRQIHRADNQVRCGLRPDLSQWSWFRYLC